MGTDIDTDVDCPFVEALRAYHGHIAKVVSFTLDTSSL